MSTSLAKTTFYTTPVVQKALKRRALEADQTMSAYIQQAVLQAIAEDLADIEDIDARVGGATESLEDFLTAVRKDGLI